MGRIKKAIKIAGIFTTALIIACATAWCAGYLVDYSRDSIALGFSGSGERWKAEAAGFTDPAAYRSYLAERERQEAADAARRDAAREREDMLFSACFEAQQTIKAQLKAPSTAVFDSCLRRGTIDTKDNSKVTVVGYVDAQNSFGAMLRSTYVVILQRVSGSGIHSRFHVISAALI